MLVWSWGVRIKVGFGVGLRFGHNVKVMQGFLRWARFRLSLKYRDFDSFWGA